MTKDEALKLALEALEKGVCVDPEDSHRAIYVIREALAQQQQEPVAWVYLPHKELLWPHEVERKNPLELNEYMPLYTSPPARKPLTDEEIYKIANDLFYGNGPCDTLAMCRAIEAAHGIKGEA